MKLVVRAAGAFALVAMLMVAGFAGAARVAAQDGTANVRVIHASPDAPAVDIWVNGEVAISDLAFGEATDWIALPADSYDVAVAPAGADAADAVLEATLDLEAGVNYNVAAIGFLADISATIFTTDTADLAEGQARVQVVHLSPDTPGVDVAVAGGPVLIENLEFPDASGALDVDAGSYDLEVRPAGTEDVALDLPGVELAAGTAYDVLAIGSLEDGTLTVLPLTTDAAAGGEDELDGVGGGTTVPSTGVGSTIESMGMMAWAFLAAAVVLAVAGGAAAIQPARRRI
jgi:hypothetical protein